MSASPTLESPQVRWDLSSLFSGLDDPRIPAAWVDLHARADVFATTYRGQIDAPSLTADTLLAFLRDLEAISRDAAKPMVYANLRFAVEATNQAVAAFMQAQSEHSTELRVKLLFAELELQQADDAVINRLLVDPRLQPYGHFVRNERKMRAHRLSEAEEIILEECANTGCRSWVRFHEEVTTYHQFAYTAPDGTTSELTMEEIMDRLRDADRTVRQAAADALSAGLEELEHRLVFGYNVLLQDKRVDDRLRKFETAEQSRHLANELDQSTVDLVTNLVAENYGMVARFYRVKQRILGHELTHIDRYAPLAESARQVPFEEGRQIVLDAFGAFDPGMREVADEFFTQHWIDAEAREGKTGGAFCSYNTTDTHPVVMMSYLNKLSDVSTLAHELGHGVHASLSRAQTEFNFHGTLPLAELASIFGESLVFDRLVQEAEARDQLALYAEKIEGSFASVFRQVAMYRFERQCHQARREQGELTPDQFGDLWQNEIQAMFGDSLSLGEQHRRWWMYVGHFVFAPFYVYAYAFGELLTLALYERARAEGPSFAPKYLDMLRLGGSQTPHELMAHVGVDLNDPEFWRGGLRVIESQVARFEALGKELNLA